MSVRPKSWVMNRHCSQVTAGKASLETIVGHRLNSDIQARPVYVSKSLVVAVAVSTTGPPLQHQRMGLTARMTASCLRHVEAVVLNWLVIQLGRSMHATPHCCMYHSVLSAVRMYLYTIETLIAT